MKRWIETKATLVSSPEELVIELTQADVSLWALELTLLLEGLCTQTKVQFEDRSTVVMAILADRRADRTVFTRQGTSAFTCELATTQAEYVRATLLHAYRDGMAEVNHVHVEGFFEAATFELTFMFDR